MMWVWLGMLTSTWSRRGAGFLPARVNALRRRGWAACFLKAFVWALVVVAALPTPAASLSKHLLPQGGLDFPVDDQGRVLTALRRSYPQRPDVPPGPSLQDARRAASALPFVVTLASTGQDVGAASSRSAVIHGAFRSGLPMRLAQAQGAAFCRARTGATHQEENAYGTAYPVTDVVAAAGCGSIAGPMLAVIGSDIPDYRRVVPRPVRDKNRVRRLQQRARRGRLLLEAPRLAASGPASARLPLVRAERLPGTPHPTYVLTYGGQEGVAMVYRAALGQDNRRANPSRGVPLAACSAALLSRASSPLSSPQNRPAMSWRPAPGRLRRGSFRGPGNDRARWVRGVAELGGKNLAEKRKNFRGSTSSRQDASACLTR